MTHNLTADDLNTSDKKIVALNQDIGYLLIEYLNGLNVINFIEAVNDSDQFGTIEITNENIFFRKFMKLMQKEKIKLNVPTVYCYLDACSIDDEGYVRPKQQFYQTDAPVLRLFIHPTFTNDAFEHLCSTYKTSSFQCYTRLLSFNTHTYVGNLILVDFFSYKHSNGYNRELNIYERNLFKECLFFRLNEHNVLNNQLSFVQSITEFMANFETRFKSSAWLEAIDFSKFHISGGCIVNSLCKQPFPDTATEQVDINFNGHSFSEFDNDVTYAFPHLKSVLSKNGYFDAELIKKPNGSYVVILPFDVKLQFNYKDVPNDTDPVSYVLHSSDLDITQVALIGSQILCTFAFLQAIATTSFMCYTMHGNMEKNICNRIIRYCQRGFTFLEPHEFDSLVYIDTMDGTVLEENREETREIMDEDGEIQTVTIAYHPRTWPLPNVDTYQLQENFMKQISSQKFQ